MYNFKYAYLSITLLLVGFMLHYMPMFVMGMKGMPRRYFDYLPEFEGGNLLAGIGAVIMVAGLFLMFGNLLNGARKGAKATDNPWGGITLEWSVPSPPPLHNFLEQPQVKQYPYDFSDVLKRHDLKASPPATHH